ncbi:DUF1488 domain-containing protein [Xanthobacteraceae bacterium Astr-EGSB]|uniref:DUF1488 domain-containing protein n=1 Tax=Astrobacterium formosum TaxID=3069710 RepID=UPI0027B3AB46|nr:DUF1488 domain-containing protein [Xanthobacteraceae bacterium Astr-EGSB]
MLQFPNPSRSYDATRHAVRFWGHEGAMEACFFICSESLARLQPGIQPSEADLLRAFDANRDRIQEIALKVYGRGRRGSYDLVVGDF